MTYTRKKSIRISKKTLRKKLKQRDGNSCGKCGEKMNKYEITIEHIKPKSCGGEDKLNNLKLFCKECNQKLGRKHSDCLQKSKSMRKCCKKYKITN